MKLVQIFLPLQDNDGRDFPRHYYAAVRKELLQQFDGLTMYNRAPAKGLWKADEGHLAVDNIIIVEVQVVELDRDWWKKYKLSLEQRFAQNEIVIRSQDIELL